MIARFNGNVVPFADDSTSTNRTVFGGVTQSDAIDDNLNADFKKGWEIVGLNDNPTREDFNAMGYTLGALISYLYEMGISEWNTSQNYRVNSRVMASDGNLYKSLTGTSGTPNVGNNPLSDVVNWKSLEAVFLTGNQTIAGIKTFISSPIVPTPTTNTQAVNKAYVDGKYSGFKNYIINGKKVLNQRGLTSTDNRYNQDRWYKAGNNWFQGIEAGNNLISGKTYTLSWVGSATASYYIGNATSSTINSQTFIPIENSGSFTLTISAGQNLWIKFASNATGSTFNFVQLEEGSVATPFENRPIGLELSLCQRYFKKGVVGHNETNPKNDMRLFFYDTYIDMRVAPTVSDIVVLQNDSTRVGTISASSTDTNMVRFTAIVIGATGDPIWCEISYSLQAEL